MRHRLILNTVKSGLAKNQRYTGSKNDKCPPPPPTQPPCCDMKKDPPPCPPPPPPCGPPQPPPVCTVIPDPNNPCNYVRPENADPDEPDMTNIKRRQCLYQKEETYLPTYLIGGAKRVYFFQFTTILGIINLILSFVAAYHFVSQ